MRDINSRRGISNYIFLYFLYARPDFKGHTNKRELSGVLEVFIVFILRLMGFVFSHASKIESGKITADADKWMKCI
jgi:hypothetical protein